VSFLSSMDLKQLDMPQIAYKLLFVPLPVLLGLASDGTVHFFE